MESQEHKLTHAHLTGYSDKVKPFGRIFPFVYYSVVYNTLPLQDRQTLTHHARCNKTPSIPWHHRGTDIKALQHNPENTSA